MCLGFGWDAEGTMGLLSHLSHRTAETRCQVGVAGKASERRGHLSWVLSDEKSAGRKVVGSLWAAYSFYRAGLSPD